MIFTKKYIRQVIKEEITNYVAMKKKLKSDKGTKLDSLRKELIHTFIELRDKITNVTAGGIKNNSKSLEKVTNAVKHKYGLEHLSYVKFIILAIHILEGRVDPQLLSFIKSIAKSDKKFELYYDKLDNYGMSISPDEEKQTDGTHDPDPTFMRVPKSDNAVDDQEDLRRDRKTLTQS